MFAIALAASSALVLATTGTAHAQASQTELEVYGFAMLDIGHNFDAINPNWFDTMRVDQAAFVRRRVRRGPQHVRRRPAVPVRRPRSTPTPLGDLKTTFEFELFGVGVDEGQTTFRLRHAYGELGAFGAGQTWSPFMDPDVFPNSLEYWGPTGMVFFRNVQVRWMPVRGDNTNVTIALERPGASGDGGTFDDRIELQNLSRPFSVAGSHGPGDRRRRLGLRARRRLAATHELGRHAGRCSSTLSGDATGWGLNLSSNLNFGEEKTSSGCSTSSARAFRTT